MKTITTPIENGVLDRMLDPLSDCLTPAMARRLAKFRADAATQARVDELATKCNEGELTPAERREYEAYVRAISPRHGWFLPSIASSDEQHSPEMGTASGAKSVRILRSAGSLRPRWCRFTSSTSSLASTGAEHVYPTSRWSATTAIIINKRIWWALIHSPTGEPHYSIPVGTSGRRISNGKAFFCSENRHRPHYHRSLGHER